jgi:hypothetical protein
MRRLALAFVVLALRPLHSVASEACVTVNDRDGLPLPKSLIVATNLTTFQATTGATDEFGKHCFAGIPEGLYSFEAGLSGFLNVRYYPVHVKFDDLTSLEFRLPFGDISRERLAPEAMISGTLRRGAAPLAGATICLFKTAAEKPVRCVETTELGEYAVGVPPAIYEVEIRLGRGGQTRPMFQPGHGPAPGSECWMRLDLSSPGHYRNVLSFPEGKPER